MYLKVNLIRGNQFVMLSHICWITPGLYASRLRSLNCRNAYLSASLPPMGTLMISRLSLFLPSLTGSFCKFISCLHIGQFLLPDWMSWIMHNWWKTWPHWSLRAETSWSWQIAQSSNAFTCLISPAWSSSAPCSYTDALWLILNLISGKSLSRFSMKALNLRNLETSE